MGMFTSTVAGTPIYMAPEVLKGQKYTDTADMWSLGNIMPFWCNGGTHLFADLGKIISWPGGKSTLPGRYTIGLRQLVADMLHPDPQCRPSAEKVLQETEKDNRQKHGVHTIPSEGEFTTEEQPTPKQQPPQQPPPKQPSPSPSRHESECDPYAKLERALKEIERDINKLELAAQAKQQRQAQEAKQQHQAEEARQRAAANYGFAAQPPTPGFFVFKRKDACTRKFPANSRETSKSCSKNHHQWHHHQYSHRRQHQCSGTTTNAAIVGNTNAMGPPSMQLHHHQYSYHRQHQCNGTTTNDEVHSMVSVQVPLFFSPILPTAWMLSFFCSLTLFCSFSLVPVCLFPR